MAHARLSPSAAHRWLQCPGSPALAARFGVDITSPEAAFGTLGHRLAAEVLDAEGAVDLFERVGEQVEIDGQPVEVTEELVEAVLAYTDALLRTPAEMRAVEIALSIEELTGEAGAAGTADAVLLTPDGTLEVHDLKLGAGVAVYAAENPQLLTYLLAAADLFAVTDNIRAYRAVIHQPRVFDEPQVWNVSPERLAEFREQLRVAAEAAWNAERAAQRIIDAPDAPGVRPLLERVRAWAEGRLRPSESACRWCPAKRACPAQQQLAADAFERFEAAGGTPEAAKAGLLAEVALDGPERLAEWLRLVPVVEQWADAVRAAAMEVAASGELPGWKLVEGRPGNRRYAEPERAAALLTDLGVPADVAYVRKLASPAQLEKALAKRRPDVWAALQDLIVRPPGRPTLVPLVDSRPPLSQVRAEQFPKLGGD